MGPPGIVIGFDLTTDHDFQLVDTKTNESTHYMFILSPCTPTVWKGMSCTPRVSGAFEMRKWNKMDGMFNDVHVQYTLTLTWPFQRLFFVA